MHLDRSLNVSMPMPMTISECIHALFIHVIHDIGSIRVQILYGIFGVFLYAIHIGVNFRVLLCILSLLHIIILFYFTSKHSEKKQQHEIKIQKLCGVNNDFSAQN